MRKYFVCLFEYELWANKKILAALEMKPTSKEIVDFFSHMLADMTPWVILLRKEVLPENINCQPSWSIEQCRKELDELHVKINSYLNSATEMEFGNIIKSKGPGGKIFTNTVTEVLTHMASHSEHHRGQMETHIREKTGSHLPLSYMRYLRESNTEPVTQPDREKQTSILGKVVGAAG